MGGLPQPDPSTLAPVAGPVDMSDLLANPLHDRSAAGRFGALEAARGLVVMSFLGFVIVVVGAVVIANAWIATPVPAAQAGAAADPVPAGDFPLFTSARHP